MQIAVVAVCIVLFTTPVIVQALQTQEVPVVLAPHQESILAAEIESRVTVIAKEFGQNFVQGELLVRLDSRAAKLGVRRAKARLEEARKEFNILQDLHTTKSVSTLEFEEARSKQVVAEVDLAIANQKLARCTVKAPFTGRVAKVLVNEHEWVKTGAALIEIVDDSVLRAKFLLPSSLYGDVATGDKVVVTIQETGQSYDGLISHIGAKIEPSSRSFELFAEVKNDSTLRSGMRGTAVLQPK